MRAQVDATCTRRRQRHIWIVGDMLSQAIERCSDPRALVGSFHFIALVSTTAYETAGASSARIVS
jgi:hypothetical protein